MMPYVLYHAGCGDGFGAAWAAWRGLSREGAPAKYLPVVHGKPLPEMEAGSRVFIVDFSYPREVLLELDRRMAEVVVLDHHDTARAELEGLPFARFDMKKSGAVLTWEYFFPGYEIPLLLLHVQDRDLWTWKLAKSREVSAALRSYPMEFDVWERLVAETPRLRTEGEAILRAERLQVERVLLGMHRRWVAGHADVPMCCSPLLQSEVAEAMLERCPEAPFVAVYHDATAERRVWSLRSRPGFNVGALARQFGGGGHPCAAGFREVLKVGSEGESESGPTVAELTAEVREHVSHLERVAEAVGAIVGYKPHADNLVADVQALGSALERSQQRIRDLETTGAEALTMEARQERAEDALRRDMLKAREQYAIVMVDKRGIPKGSELVEAYDTGSHIVVLGDPPAEQGGEEETGHNCDTMGCGTLSHVIFRFRKGEDTSAVPPQEEATALLPEWLLDRAVALGWRRQVEVQAEDSHWRSPAGEQFPYQLPAERERLAEAMRATVNQHREGAPRP